jgi:hypothetical protein
VSDDDFNREMRREKLRDLQSRRRAREHDEVFDLIERTTLLAVAVMATMHLLQSSDPLLISVLGCGVGGAITLVYRDRR